MTRESAQVPWKNLLGAVGEDAVQAHLKYFSISSKYDVDAGIDFYCELIENNSPSIPFYVQAKAVEHFDKTWGRSISKSTIKYWLNQQHPVFLIIYDDETKNCYWMSIEDRRQDFIKKINSTDTDTIYISVDRTNMLEQKKDANVDFVNKIKIDSGSILLFQGRPPFLGNEYVKQVPLAPRTPAELLQIHQNVRASMYSLVRHQLEKGDLEKAYSYCRFLAEFDKNHYTHFVWLGRTAKALNLNDVAQNGYGEAIRLLELDKNWPDDSKRNILSALRAEMQDHRRSKPRAQKKR